MDFALDILDTSADCRLRHVQRLLDFHQRARLDAEVENRQLLIGEIALPPKALTLRLGKLGLDVQGRSPFLFLGLNFDPRPLRAARFPDSCHYPRH